MRSNFAPRSSKDGRIGALLLQNDDGRVGIRLRISRGDGLSDHKGLSVTQAIAIVEVLDLACREVNGYSTSYQSDRGIAKFLTKHRATNGRATAMVKVSADDRTIITLGIAKSANRFDHIDLRPAEARSVLDVVAQVLRDAETHRAGEAAR